MFANGYVGTAEDSVRIRRQEKEREKERKKYEKAAAEKHREAQTAGLKQFAATTSEALEHAFKNETVGLVTKADFVKKRTTLQDRMEEELRRKQQEEEQALQEEKERKRQAKMSARAGKLSFAFGEEEAPGDADKQPQPRITKQPPAPAPAPPFKLPRVAPDAPPAPSSTPSPQDQQPTNPSHPNGNSNPASNGQNIDGTALTTTAPPAAAAAAAVGVRAPTPPLPSTAPTKKLGKDPNVTTDFLPDRDRARLEAELRAQLKKEWQAQQDKVKAEPLMIVYSYWDGSGHRREIKVKKGDTIGGFLKLVKEQLVPDFRELRHVSVDNLIYVKEDIILPHHHSFYDLIVNKARGKSGPLFDFGVHEDIRVVNDASREKNESHAGKVVERHWYDRNKHIFPASRWEIYDPEKKYDTYTIYGD